MPATVLNRMAAILTDRFGIPAGEVKPDTTFAELDLDSLALVELAMALGKDLGVPIADDELPPSATLATAAELIHRRVPHHAAGRAQPEPTVRT